MIPDWMFSKPGPIFRSVPFKAKFNFMKRLFFPTKLQYGAD